LKEKELQKIEKSIKEENKSRESIENDMVIKDKKTIKEENKSRDSKSIENDIKDKKNYRK